jgi:hypothetical protein
LYFLIHSYEQRTKLQGVLRTRLGNVTVACGMEKPAVSLEEPQKFRFREWIAKALCNCEAAQPKGCPDRLQALDCLSSDADPCKLIAILLSGKLKPKNIMCFLGWSSKHLVAFSLELSNFLTESGRSCYATRLLIFPDGHVSTARPGSF